MSCPDPNVRVTTGATARDSCDALAKSTLRLTAFDGVLQGGDNIHLGIPSNKNMPQQFFAPTTRDISLGWIEGPELPSEHPTCSCSSKTHVCEWGLSHKTAHCVCCQVNKGDVVAPLLATKSVQDMVCCLAQEIFSECQPSKEQHTAYSRIYKYIHTLYKFYLY